eukprot:9785471-Alexandrium_andersonii.AAC.1
MSASLVGSEMCIRDRPSELRNAPEVAFSWLAAMANLIEQGARWPSVPVSYTHLTLPTICSV